MAVTVTWRDGWKHPIVTPSLRQLPRKAVVWWGDAVIYMKDGSRLESSWHSRRPISAEQAKEAMRAVAADMIADLENPDDAVDSGFVMKCR
ncbi:hypothetical protein PEp14_00046 [Erwinia phage PEp14]|uniref:Uncharacterized protein n=1 Tax=Erwinia phage PEp14 TaxID=1131315 RepID=H2DE76_9CAUD|nr:hypothetical protein PEp14_00046 [Erwinia phage PEp14]AEY69635.1 hypothetical protein PEp14_00046 [Erwinia phage PEp14]